MAMIHQEEKARSLKDLLYGSASMVASEVSETIAQANATDKARKSAKDAAWQDHVSKMETDPAVYEDTLDEWIAQEEHRQGFSDENLKTLLEHEHNRRVAAWDRADRINDWLNARALKASDGDFAPGWLQRVFQYESVARRLDEDTRQRLQQKLQQQAETEMKKVPHYGDKPNIWMG